MPRRRLFDMMQTHPFWLFDVSGGSFVGALANALFGVFDPSFGFSQISSPEISIALKQIQPGNWEYTRNVVKTASVAPITLSRGTRFFDSDFYNWTTSAIRGKDPVRKTLALVHFLTFRPLSQATGADNTRPDLGIVQFGLRVPGRAWMLHDCVPQRYKAGSDFDASSGAVSIQELEVQPEYIDELTIGTVNPTVARTIAPAVTIANAVT